MVRACCTINADFSPGDGEALYGIGYHQNAGNITSSMCIGVAVSA
jgi:hypothetical protein